MVHQKNPTTKAWAEYIKKTKTQDSRDGAINIKQ